MKNLSLIIPVTVLTSLALLGDNLKPVSAQQCVPLQVVGGTGTSVTKRVSNLLGVADNRNTDFAVPNNSNFSKFVATIKSSSTASVNLPVQMFLKYPDNTAGQTFDGNVALQPKQSKQLIGSPRKDQQPFQVNLKVGGTGTSGFSYTLYVVGCK